MAITVSVCPTLVVPLGTVQAAHHEHTVRRTSAAAAIGRTREGGIWRPWTHPKDQSELFLSKKKRSAVTFFLQLWVIFTAMIMVLPIIISVLRDVIFCVFFLLPNSSKNLKSKILSELDAYISTMRFKTNFPL